jgi:hypothetical protein
MGTVFSRLTRVDESCNIQSGVRRSESVLAIFRDLRVHPRARLNYYPQPALTEHTNWEFQEIIAAASEGPSFDLSFDCLLESFRSRSEYPLLQRFRNNWGPNFLTYLDLFAALAPRDRTPEMVDRRNIIAALLRELDPDSAWRHAVRSVSDRYSNCALYLLLHRLSFYYSRSMGLSFTEFQSYLPEIRELFGIPEEWNVAEEIATAEMLAENERDNIMDAFDDKVEFKWASNKIPITGFANPVCEDAPDLVCIICTERAPPSGVVTKKCGHAYCRECLEKWAYACQPTSHKCPTCRAELFPKPTYTPVEPDIVRNYQAELESLDMVEVGLRVAQISSDWYDREMALHRDCEAGSARSSENA